MFKVGDTVKIRKTYISPHDHDNDYPCSFIKEMLKDFGGQSATITKVYNNYQYDRKYYNPDFPYSFRISIDDGCFIWSPSMFESGGPLRKTITIF